MDLNCPKCGSSLDVDDSMRGQLVTCNGCENVAEVPRNQPHIVVKNTQVSGFEMGTVRGEQPASEYLRIVRESSNYAAFRSAVKIAELLAIGAAVLVSLGVAGAAAGSILPGAGQGKADSNTALISVVIGYATLVFLALFLVIRAVKQALIVAIDIADMVADQGRRKRQ